MPLAGFDPTCPWDSKSSDWVVVFVGNYLSINIRIVRWGRLVRACWRSVGGEAPTDDKLSFVTVTLCIRTCPTVSFTVRLFSVVVSLLFHHNYQNIYIPESLSFITFVTLIEVRIVSFPPKRPDRLWGPPSAYFIYTGVFSWGWRGWGVNLVTGLHLVLSLRMTGGKPTLPPYDFMASTQTSLYSWFF